MTRIYFQAGRLRLRLILIELALVALFAGVNLAGYATVFEMSAGQLWLQGLVYAVLALLVFAALATYTWTTLRPVALLMRELREGGLGRIDRASAARRAALRFPLSVAVLALVTSHVALALGLTGDIAFIGLEPSFAIALAAMTASELLVTCIFIYLVARALLRPVVAHFRHEEVPSGIRVKIGGKVLFVTVSLCVFATVPMALVCETVVSGMQRLNHERKQQHLAEVVAHGVDTLPPSERFRAIAAVHLPDGRRIRFRSTPSPTAALAAASGPGAYVEVAGGEPPTALRTSLVVLSLLIIGLAALVGSRLGANLSHDVRLVSSRITQLAEGMPLAERKRLRPLVAEAPQFRDLRQLADALNDLLDRMVHISVTDFLAVEKTVEAERVKTQFLANVSHDLRSPLNIIIGFSQLLTQDATLQLAPQQRRDLEVILRSGATLLQQINMVLDYARLDAGRLRLHREDSLPAELVSRALKEVQRAGVPAEVQIETELQPGMKQLMVDPQRLTQAMVHILRWCVQSIDRGPVVIKLSLESHGDEGTAPIQRHLLFTARTTSGGMREVDLHRLFSGFHRRPDRRGLGLELPLAKAFIELHDGSLHATSTLGMGTTFVARIPMLEPQALVQLRRRRELSGPSES